MKRLQRLSSILAFEDSRKVAIALWLFITTHLLLIFKFITSSEWLAAVMASVTLIGGGTVADAYLDRKPAAKPDKD